jgi:hypothetical protein
MKNQCIETEKLVSIGANLFFVMKTLKGGDDLVTH